MAVMLAHGDVAQISLSSTGSWETVDLDNTFGSLPAGCTGAMLVCMSPATRYSYGVREYNNTNFTTYNDVRQLCRIPIYVKCDSSHRIEIYRENSGLSFYLVGYFTTDVDWRSSPVDVTPATSGSWADIDLSSYTSGGELFAILQLTTTLPNYGANLRYNGASDNRIRGTCSGNHWVIMPLDGSDIVEVNMENYTKTTVDLIGFITDGTKRTSGGSDLFASIGLGSFQDITLPDTGHEIACLEIYSNTIDLSFDLRANGGTSQPSMYGYEYQHNGIFTVAIDGSDLAEAKCAHGAIECYCWGYLESVAAGGADPGYLAYKIRQRSFTHLLRR